MVGDGVNVVMVTVPLHIFVKDRELPISANWAIGFRADDVPEDAEKLTDIVTNFMMEKLDSRSTRELILEDDEGNKVIVKRKAYQAMRVLTPSDYDPANYA